MLHRLCQSYKFSDSLCLAHTSNQTINDSRKMELVRKKTNPNSLTFLVEYKHTARERYYRELEALKLLRGKLMIDMSFKIVNEIIFSSFIQGVTGVAQLMDLENASNRDDQQLLSKNNLSFLIEHRSGDTLSKYINEIHRGGFGVLEAIQLVQNLIIIVKQVHSKGVLHQNLCPDNIMLDWNSKQTSIEDAQLILINFSQAYIESDRSERMIQSTAPCWYKAPQSNDESLKYSSTIDASGICAILLWLLTDIEPSQNSGRLPHEPNHVEDKINKKIAEATRNASM